MNQGQLELVEAYKRAIITAVDYDAVMDRMFDLIAFAEAIHGVAELAKHKALQMAQTPMQTARIRLVQAS